MGILAYISKSQGNSHFPQVRDGVVMHARSQQWMPEFLPNNFLLNSWDTMTGPDLLNLRHDQQLEYAKEYSSILAEPLGSRLKSRFASCRHFFSPCPYHAVLPTSLVHGVPA